MTLDEIQAVCQGHFENGCNGCPFLIKDRCKVRIMLELKSVPLDWDLGTTPNFSEEERKLAELLYKTSCRNFWVLRDSAGDLFLSLGAEFYSCPKDWFPSIEAGDEYSLLEICSSIKEGESE
jgi:hypothetical protein